MSSEHPFLPERGLSVSSVNPGLKLALTYIDSKINGTIDLRKTLSFGDRDAYDRVEGALTALMQLRERIVRAIGPDAE